MAVTLCHIDDIPEGGARGFEVSGTRIFAVKQLGKIYIYLNRCPHLGTPLEWDTDQFLDSEGLYIKCSTHGAFFIKETGECIQGPCRGELLWEIEHSLDDSQVVIQDEALPATFVSG